MLIVDSLCVRRTDLTWTGYPTALLALIAALRLVMEKFDGMPFHPITMFFLSTLTQWISGTRLKSSKLEMIDNSILRVASTPIGADRKTQKQSRNGVNIFFILFILE